MLFSSDGYNSERLNKEGEPVFDIMGMAGCVHRVACGERADGRPEWIATIRTVPSYDRIVPSRQSSARQTERALSLSRYGVSPFQV